MNLKSYLIIILLFCTQLSDAQFDKSFNRGSVITNIYGTYGCKTSSSAYQPDGKIVLGGTAINGVNHDLCLIRYNPDLSLDSLFGVDGIVLTAINGENAFSKSLALQPDGKILLAGVYSRDQDSFGPTLIVRYNNDGSLDDSFGSGGIVMIESSITGYVALDLQPDGKIIASHRGPTDGSERSDFLLFRLNSNGSADTSFGVGGKTKEQLAQIKHGQAITVKVLPNGQILAAGMYQGSLGIHGGLVRYNSDGTIDSNFGIDGLAQANHSEFHSLKIQPDSKIVCAGWASDTVNWWQNLFLTRYDSSGIVDRSFGDNGKVYTALENRNIYAVDIAVQSNNKILLIGNDHKGSVHKDDDPNILLARYNENGALDFTFGANGIIETDFGQLDYASSLLIPSIDKILVGGYTNNSIHYSSFPEFLLVEYHLNTEENSTLDSVDFLTFHIDLSKDVANSVVIQPDSKLLVAGHSDNKPALVRYDSIGHLDYFFGNHGIIRADLIDTAIEAVLQFDSSILLIGKSNILRYTSFGFLDKSYGIEGVVSIDSMIVTSAQLQSDNKLLVAGYSISPDTSIVLLRYFPDGSMDNTFGSNGKAIVNLNDQRGYAYSLSLQPDSKIIVGGDTRSGVYQSGSDDLDFTIIRFNPNGVPDGTFGTNGVVITKRSISNDHCNSIALQNDGKILASGSTDNSFILMRYTSGGEIDHTFGTNGFIISDTIGFSGNKINIQTYQSRIIVLVDGKRLVSFNMDGDLDDTFGSAYLIPQQSHSISYNDAICQPDGKVVLVGAYLNDFYTARVLPDGYTHMKKFQSTISNLYVYPNPTHSGFGMNYTLTKNEEICVSLYDLGGCRIYDFIENEFRPAGANNENFQFDKKLAPGTYLLQFRIKDSQKTIQLIKL